MQSNITLVRQKNRDYKIRMSSMIIVTLALLITIFLIPSIWLIIYVFISVIVVWAFGLGLFLPIKITIDNKGLLIDISRRKTTISWDDVKQIKNQRVRYAHPLRWELGSKGTERLEIIISTENKYNVLTPKLPNVEKTGFVYPKELQLTTRYFLESDLKGAFLIINQYANDNQITVKDNLNWIEDH